MRCCVSWPNKVCILACARRLHILVRSRERRTSSSESKAPGVGNPGVGGGGGHGGERLVTFTFCVNNATSNFHLQFRHFPVQHLTGFYSLLQCCHCLLLYLRMLLSVGQLLFDVLHVFFYGSPQRSPKV